MSYLSVNIYPSIYWRFPFAYVMSAALTQTLICSEGTLKAAACYWFIHSPSGTRGDKVNPRPLLNPLSLRSFIPGTLHPIPHSRSPHFNLLLSFMTRLPSFIIHSLLIFTFLFIPLYLIPASLHPTASFSPLSSHALSQQPSSPFPYTFFLIASYAPQSLYYPSSSLPYTVSRPASFTIVSPNLFILSLLIPTFPFILLYCVPSSFLYFCFS